jgi:hypothetical protein
MLAVIAGAALSATALAQSTDATRAYAAELAADAGSRTSFRADGGAGYDAQGFMIGSGDGNNVMYVFGSAQIRYNMNFGDNGDEDPNFPDRDDFTAGFDVPLARIGVHGNVWDKALTYQVRGQFTDEGTDSGNTGSFQLETAFAKYTWDNGFGLQFGQMKSPYSRESMIDNEYQLAINRSITERIFGAGYTQGIQLEYTSEQFRVWGGFTDGINTQNTAWAGSGEADWALNARGEFKVMGNSWERFGDFTSWRSAEDMGLVIGAAIWYQQRGGDTGGVPDENDILLYTIDAQVEGKGWNAYGSFYGGSTDNVDPDVSDTDNFGAVIQGGIFVTDQVEIFGRWDAIFWDSAITDAGGDDADDNHFLTAGVNYYLSPESHAAKFTLDAIYSVNGTIILFAPDSDPDDGLSDGGPLAGTDYTGLLGQSEDGEFGLQLQFQVVW